MSRSPQYEAQPQGLIQEFDQYGEVKGHFDLVKGRGMLFITYVRCRF